MAYNFGEILVVCSWFSNVVEQQHPRAKAWMIQRGAASQATAFKNMANELCMWFPEGNVHHEDALAMSVDLNSCAQEFHDLTHIASCFLTSYDSACNFFDHADMLPLHFQLRLNLQNLYDLKRTEAQYHMTSLMQIYPQFELTPEMFADYPPRLALVPSMPALTHSLGL